MGDVGWGGGVALCGQQDFQEQRPKKKKETNNNTKKYCSIFILFSEKKIENWLT